MNYQEEAKQARIKVLDLIFRAQTSHIGSNFSCIDIMTVLFDKIDLDKDKFILSKGWAAASLYYFLWRKGRITEEELNSYCQEGSKFIGLAEPIISDIPFAGGSMGFGLPAAVGYALSKKLKGEEGKVYCLMSDGELNCGTVWEAASIASHHKLDNLVVFIDNNGFQAMGKTRDILEISNLGSKLELFGCDWKVIDGHNHSEIEDILGLIPKLIEKKNKWAPTVLIAETIKGKGVNFMEGNNLWHYKAPNKDEYELALKELKG